MSDVITCGVDIGARSIDMVLFDGANIIASRVAESGPRPALRAEEEFALLLKEAELTRNSLATVVATGYGRNRFEADHTASEIICHAAGTAHTFPEARALVDIGGQDSKGLILGANGKVLNFAMNDRCAAGTGRFIEMVAVILQISLDEAATLALDGTGAREINSMCAVFAETEIIGLIQTGVEINEILRGVYRAVAKRTITLLGQVPDGAVAFSGGVAKNAGVRAALKEQLKREILVAENPQIIGALGAAIVGIKKLNG